MVFSAVHVKAVETLRGDPRSLRGRSLQSVHAEGGPPGWKSASAKSDRTRKLAEDYSKQHDDQSMNPRGGAFNRLLLFFVRKPRGGLSSNAS